MSLRQSRAGETPGETGEDFSQQERKSRIILGRLSRA